MPQTHTRQLDINSLETAGKHQQAAAAKPMVEKEILEVKVSSFEKTFVCEISGSNFQNPSLSVGGKRRRHNMHSEIIRLRLAFMIAIFYTPNAFGECEFL